jgi:hypothetical protein
MATAKSYPSYMMEIHERWLHISQILGRPPSVINQILYPQFMQDSYDTVKWSMIDSMNKAFDSYTFQPDVFTPETVRTTAYSALQDYFNKSVEFADNLFILTGLDDHAKVELQSLQDDFSVKVQQVKTRFRNIAGVHTSAFVIASAILHKQQLNLWSSFISEQVGIRVEQAYKRFYTDFVFSRQLPIMITEVNRLSYMTYFTMEQFKNEREAFEALFNLRVYRNAVKMLVAISGRVVPSEETMEYIHQQQLKMTANMYGSYASMATWLILWYLYGWNNPVGWIATAVGFIVIASFYNVDLLENADKYNAGGEGLWWATAGMGSAFTKEWNYNNSQGGGWATYRQIENVMSFGGLSVAHWLVGF